jgi:hypothetical protein
VVAKFRYLERILPLLPATSYDVATRLDLPVSRVRGLMAHYVKQGLVWVSGHVCNSTRGSQRVYVYSAGPGEYVPVVVEATGEMYEALKLYGPCTLKHLAEKMGLSHKKIANFWSSRWHVRREHGFRICAWERQTIPGTARSRIVAVYEFAPGLPDVGKPRGTQSDKERRRAQLRQACKLYRLRKSGVPRSPWDV